MIVGRICEKHPELGGKRYNSGHCVQCKKDANRKWDSANAESVRENATKRMQRFRQSDDVRQRDRERAVDWYYKNQERAKQVAREGRKMRYALDPSQAIWEARVRRDKVAQQTPRWADRIAISAIYRKARELGMTVDHTIPLQGKNVSGLHVEHNLQILPRSENSSKGNRF